MEKRQSCRDATLAADDAAVADPRVRGVVAVSPPLRLLFDHGASRSMHGRAVVVSGSRDWVVPFGPEALHPFVAVEDIRGHQLVLVDGGTHFNLRPGPQAENAVLRDLMLIWVQPVLAAGDRARPASGATPLLPRSGWGDAERPLMKPRRHEPRPPPPPDGAGAAQACGSGQSC